GTGRTADTECIAARIADTAHTAAPVGTAATVAIAAFDWRMPIEDCGGANRACDTAPSRQSVRRSWARRERNRMRRRRYNQDGFVVVGRAIAPGQPVAASSVAIAIVLVRCVSRWRRVG